MLAGGRTPAKGGRLPSGWRALTLLVVVCLPCGGLREIHASDDRVLRLSGGRRYLAGRRRRAAPSPTRARTNRGRRQRRLLSAVFLRSVPIRRVLRPLLHGVVSHLCPVSVRAVLLQPQLGIGAPGNQTERRAGVRRRLLRRDRRSVRRYLPAARPADRRARDRGVLQRLPSLPAAHVVPARRELSFQSHPRAAAGGDAG